MDFSIPEPLQPILAAIRELVERAVIPLEPGLVVVHSPSWCLRCAAVRENVKARGLWRLNSRDPSAAWG